MGEGGSFKSNAPKGRKRVEASEETGSGPSLVRAKDGSAFARCDECNKNIPAALIGMHSCSLDAKIKMNLEAQVVEKPSEVKRKPAERKEAASTEPKAKKSRTEKKLRNPNAPKRPLTAFFLFMEDFRKTFKDANPDAKGIKQVAKEGGEKWKSLTDEEKKRYLDKATELKSEYEKAVKSCNDDDEVGELDSEQDLEKGKKNVEGNEIESEQVLEKEASVEFSEEE